MKYRLLGRSGLRVSELCLGTMTFGEDWGWGSPKDESKRIYNAFRDAGGNFIDTANFYTNGRSEEFLGEFMSGHRAEVVLATKYTLSGPTKNPNQSGNQRKNMMSSVHDSLKRLRTDYIDLYWVHIWDQITPVEEVMRGLDDLVRQGKVLYAGISDAPAWWVAQANTLAQFRGWAAFAGLQIEYSLIERTPERELLPMAEALGLSVTAWSPLAGGMLTGKYQKQAGRADSGPRRLEDPEVRKFSSGDEERKERIVREVVSLSQKIGCSPAQLSLAWLHNRAEPVIPIIGARKLPQLQDNLKSLDLKPEPDMLQTLNNVSAVDLGFPHNFYARDMVKSVVYGGLRDQIVT